MNLKHAKINAGGRVVIPAALRRQLGLKIGDEVVLSVDDDELRLRSFDSAIRRAQGIVRRYVGGEARLSDELIADRRREAADD
ncbi:MAG TPA: AbrB/MazE/SpoVT family DNA-binding domain-containing protein [Gammaproteobacteria bacterium]|nr:AbrB/MazE/SpoVT family DNA-binding domain-containing protein [Gammaproteobacteria bacterium]